ncbi:glycosyltransferase [filamentous cyanobacterium LEGE 11480]|uniref:Glycosyltransferase n=1 Tax=Romeriopsis navalis LEGE 11480 TaxID=2777977 RepID=A0A928VQH3_9CYAN|nr:glycosyltransferase [Romeriopsis navalis]MBE9030254.1 glycosyltransferase [Romeriopsis navalis LEGE 11480]
MKIALVHDYLTQKGGAERVFELLCRHYPDADIFTSLYDPDRTIELGDRLVNTTILQGVPGARKYFRLMAPFYYPAFRLLDLQEYDLIISSSTSFAKSVRKRPDAKHICFCHNVTRFLWDTQTYLREYSDFQNFYPILDKIFRVMRQQDLKYAQEPDIYIANSSTVAERIRKIYGKPAMVINYPIDTDQFEFSNQKDNYYLASARMISYKRLDVIIEAFNWLGWPLKITGEGPEYDRLKSQAMSNVELLGHVSDHERKTLMTNAKSVVIAALEDYGLVPIEANASGTPVISYGAGGVLDTQVSGETGVFFQRQTPESLHNALISANTMNWDYAKIRNHAIDNFSEATFFQRVEKMTNEIAMDFIR